MEMQNNKPTSVEVMLSISSSPAVSFAVNVPDALAAVAAAAKQRAIGSPLFQDAQDEETVGCAFYQSILAELDDRGDKDEGNVEVRVCSSSLYPLP